ncbi:hypothetical protein PV327_009040 [Microctonus hyperodae]|uniref:Uncharacterized protein n=1 Tax=Microctonus hyperodae TaxID=165561 RepID=A0AA39FU05_MICHY|nr:hypothetical protein PV327_009040 [Microctonus hyperodae]
MSRFFITFLTIFFIHHHQVSSYWLVKFPIIIDEVTEYVDSIQRILEKDSCLLSNDEASSENEYKIETTINQTLTAIQQLAVTSTIYDNIKKSITPNRHDDSQRHFFYGTNLIYQNYQKILERLIQLYEGNTLLLASNIYTRMKNRNVELECLRLRFIRDRNEPQKSVFHQLISVYSAQDRTTWCSNHDFSWQLSFFNFYYNMIIIEYSAFLMDVADHIFLLCYSQGGIDDSIEDNDKATLTQYLDRDSVRITISQKKEKLLSNVRQYLTALKWANTESRKNIYQCAPRYLLKGETYLEFGNTIVSEGPNYETCDTSLDSGVYEWKQDFFYKFNSDPNDPCPKQILLKFRHPNPEINFNYYNNEICVRACAPEEDPNVDFLQTISLLEQTSDIENNWVVTNVRFVEENGMVQIQIQQGELDGSNSYVVKNNRYWKPLSDVRKLSNTADNTIQFYTPGSSDFEKNFLTHGVAYINIDSNQKTLHLDDVLLPAGYVVTGVRFGYNQNSLDGSRPLELQLQGTLYDVEKNELITYLDGKPTSLWITPNVMSSSLPDYNRIRTRYEIEMTGNPFEMNGNLDSKPNQYVDFIRSQWLIRYKFRTVPFFDARPTFSKVSLPLGGVSLYGKGTTEGQSFLVLNTIPYPVSQVLNSKV